MMEYWSVGVEYQIFMQRVSTNLTLFYKFFIPVFWLAFAGAGTIAVQVMSDDAFMRMGALVAFVMSLGILFLTFFQLKRVEMSNDAVYVTNYFKHFQYPYNNIEKITHLDLLIVQIATIHLRVPGTFGKKLRFVPSNSLYKDFWESHPELKTELYKA